MKINDAERVTAMMHDVVGGLVTALFLPGVHGVAGVQQIIDQVHRNIDTKAMFLTDED